MFSCLSPVTLFTIRWAKLGGPFLNWRKRWVSHYYLMYHQYKVTGNWGLYWDWSYFFWTINTIRITNTSKGQRMLTFLNSSNMKNIQSIWKDKTYVFYITEGTKFRDPLARDGRLGWWQWGGAGWRKERWVEGQEMTRGKDARMQGFHVTVLVAYFKKVHFYRQRRVGYLHWTILNAIIYLVWCWMKLNQNLF